MRRAMRLVPPSLVTRGEDCARGSVPGRKPRSEIVTNGVPRTFASGGLTGCLWSMLGYRVLRRPERGAVDMDQELISYLDKRFDTIEADVKGLKQEVHETRILMEHL